MIDKGFLATGAIATVFAFGAQASTYNCTLQIGQTIVKTCSIETAATNPACTYSFSANISSTCSAWQWSSTTDLIQCVFTSPSSSASTRPRGTSVADVVKSFQESAGFYAGGAAIAATGTPEVAAAYIEQTGSPVLTASCAGTAGGAEMVVWWLILVGVGGAPGGPMSTHVGTFSSLANCQTAANSAAAVDTVPQGKVDGFVFACVQANDSGSAAPQ
jgi:hypothetical protein